MIGSAQSTRRCASLCALCAALALLGTAHRAHAQVVVLNPAVSPSGTSLIESVRIQLSGTGTQLRVQDLVAGEDASTQATRLVHEGALLVVWLQQRARRHVALHYVGRRANRISAARLEIEESKGPALERTLALKVREVLDEFVRPVPPSDVERPAPAHTETPRTVTMDEPIHPLARVLLGGASGSGNAGPQLQLAAAVGVGINALRGRAELWLSARWASPLARETERGSVSIREWSPLLEARTVWPSGGFDFGVHAGLGLRVVSATGTRLDGQRGQRTELVPILILGPDAALAIAPKWSLRCALGVEVALRAQSFAVDEQNLLDLGRMRALADISAVFSP